MVTELEVRTRLERLVAWATPPVLGVDEISSLLAGAARPDTTGRLHDSDSEWAPNFAYAVGDRVVPTSRSGFVYKVTASDGASGAVEPVWPAVGAVTADGVTYELTSEIPLAWQPTYDLAAAAAEGWRTKAGLVSDRYRFADDGDSYDRDQIFAHCVRMAELYERKAAGREMIVGSPAGGRSASMISLQPSGTAVAVTDEKLIVLERWDGTGDILTANGPEVIR